MPVDPRHPMFHDEDAARAYFEAQRWPDGKAHCVHCGSVNLRRLEGKSHRPGLFQCNDCLGAFSVTTKSVMESSHIPLAKSALGVHKMAASEKGISAKQMQRELGLGSYRTAWFMTMRIREAMSLPKMGPGRVGGSGKIVESDETFIGGKKKNVHKGKPRPKKRAVHALVERGVMGSFHSVSERHLGPYVDEFAFRSDTRSSLGIEDAERARLMVKGAISKRLTYRQPDEAQEGETQANKSALI